MSVLPSTLLKSNVEKKSFSLTESSSRNQQYIISSTQTKFDIYPALDLEGKDVRDELKNTIVDYIDVAANYLDEFEFKKALKTALKAYKLAKDEGDFELEIFSLLLVAQINIYWGNLEVSSLIYHKIEADRHQLNESLSQNLYLVAQLGQSTINLKSNEPDKAFLLLKEVFNSLHNIDQTIFYQDFLWNSGIAYFQKGNFIQAFDSLNKVVALSPSIYNKALLNYYEGKFYEKNETIEAALPYYMRVDSLIFGQKEVIPEAMEIYGTINNYYLEKGDQVNQYEFLNKFLKTLNVHNDISSYVKSTTRELYEIPLIIEKKQFEIEMLKEKEIQNRRLTVIIIFSMLILFSFTVFYLVKQRNYKKRFESLVQKNLKTNNEKISEVNNQNISIEVVENLMNKLEEFEENKEFLSNEISLNAVAKQFETNSSYLSKVVNLKKDKNFSNYINDLRIEHCIEKLNTHKKLRSFTIKAIADEMGYNNAQSFSSAFYKYAGIYPSFFIEQLNKTENKVS